MRLSSPTTWSPRALLAAGLLLAIPTGVCAQSTSDPGAAAATAVEGSDLRDVDVILADAVAAMGGHEQIDRIRTMTARSEMTGGGMSVTSESFWSKDGGRMVKRKMPGVPEMILGTDGTIGWQRNPMTGQYELLDERGLEQVEDSHLHIMLLHLDRSTREEFRSMKTIGRETFQEHDCWKVHFVDEQGDPGQLYFDVTSKLPAGGVMNDGPRSATMLFKDWKPLDGLMLFRHMTFTGDGEVMEVDFVEITINDLEKGFFEAPPEVKKLAEAKPATTAPADGGRALEDFPPEQQEQIKGMLDGLKQIPDAAQLRNAINSLEMAVGFAPADQKGMFEYVVQEAKKHLAGLEGG